MINITKKNFLRMLQRFFKIATADLVWNNIMQYKYSGIL
jgi:hypothetical protein